MNNKEDVAIEKESSILTAHNEQRYSKPSVFSFADDQRIRQMQAMIGEAHKTLLDVGCYDGLVSRHFLKKGCRVFGLDNSFGAVKLARDAGLDAQQTELDHPWPLEAGSIDAILAGEVIEHVLDIKTFVQEAHRVLRPNGLFVVSTPNLAAFGRRLMLLLGQNPHIEIEISGGAAGHVRYFTPHNFIQYIEEHGFKLHKRTSDVVNFNASGSIRSTLLAHLFPSIGRCLIAGFTKT